MKYLIILFYLFANLSTLGQTNTNNENTVDYRIVAFKYTDNNTISASNIVNSHKKLKIHVPNAFSPDGDGFNDRFNAVADGVEEYLIEIYNRWGEKVYFSENINESWDGTYKGSNAIQDAYVYVIKAKGIEDLYPTTLKGTVSLVR